MSRNSLALLSPLTVAVFVFLASACGPTGINDSNVFHHPSNFADPSVHGPAAIADLSYCQSCHGTDYAGNIGPSCNSCHESTGYANWTQNCTFCHGTLVANYTSSYLSLAAPQDTTHQDHLQGSTFTNGVTCNQCHILPSDLGHVDGTVTVNFGPIATTGSLTPTYAASTQTCSNVYCHGGQGSQIAWTGSVSCGSCHGIPPVDPGTPTNEHAWHVSNSSGPQLDCGKCHPGYTATTVNKPIHVDGIAEVVSPTGQTVNGWDCAACHPSEP